MSYGPEEHVKALIIEQCLGMVDCVVFLNDA